jgi:hypothetical protein
MNYKKLLILGVFFASTTANASSVTCPNSVKAGQSFTVQVTVTNRDCINDIVVNQSVLSLSGSNNGTPVVQGPWVAPLIPTLIPHATCTAPFPQNPEYLVVQTEGSHVFNSFTFPEAVDRGMKGRLSVVHAGVINQNNNKLLMAGHCTVTVK